MCECEVGGGSGNKNEIHIKSQENLLPSMLINNE